jgi:phosphoserine phosphatase RsbX
MSNTMPSIGVASRARPGELHCGDQSGFARDGNRVLVVLADGLGHGSEAAVAARAAVDSVVRDPWGPLDQLLMRCHRDIGGTRGAAVALLRLDRGQSVVEHVSVGNVEVVAASREVMRFVSVPGVVGGRVRKVVVTSQRIHPGDLFVLHTDGLSRRLDLGRQHEMDVNQLARHLVEAFASSHDDAACVVVRC